jgi:hypothetical protein
LINVSVFFRKNEAILIHFPEGACIVETIETSKQVLFNWQKLSKKRFKILPNKLNYSSPLDFL